MPDGNSFSPCVRQATQPLFRPGDARHWQGRAFFLARSVRTLYMTRRIFLGTAHHLLDEVADMEST
jgi:hypothetical protein